MKGIFKNKKGFGLLEIAVSISVIMISVIPIVNLLSLSLKEEKDVEDSLVAIYMAQEAMEIVREIRDDDWSAISAGSWAVVDKATTNCNTIRIEHGFKLVAANASKSSRVLHKGNEGYLQCDNSGGGGWKDTGFRRTVDITKEDQAGNNNQDYAKVVVSVQKGGAELYKLTSYLNNN